MISPFSCLLGLLAPVPGFSFALSSLPTSTYLLYVPTKLPQPPLIKPPASDVVLFWTSRWTMIQPIHMCTSEVMIDLSFCQGHFCECPFSFLTSCSLRPTPTLSLPSFFPSSLSPSILRLSLSSFLPSLHKVR